MSPSENFQTDQPRNWLRDQKWFQRIVVWGFLLLIWEILGMVVGPYNLPRFSQVLISMFSAFTNGDLATLSGSLLQMFFGFSLAAIVGVPIGLLMGSSRIIDCILGIYVNALFVTSMEALLPFVIILVGTEFKFRVAVVFLFSIFYVIINTAAGVRAVDPNLLETAAAFCTPRFQVFRKIILPATLPYVIAGLRLGLGHSVKGMIIAELWIIVDTGKRLWDLGFARNLPEFFSLAMWIVLFGAISSQLLIILQEKLTPWAETSGILGTQTKRQ